MHAFRLTSNVVAECCVNNTCKIQSKIGNICINPNKPGVPFVGHKQTMQTQMRHLIMQHLIRVFTVCLEDFQLQKEQYEKKYT